MQEKGALRGDLTEADLEALTQGYLDAYRTEVRLHVGRYRSKLKRLQARQHEDP